MKRLSFPRELLPVSVVLVLLGCTAIAVPLLSNLDRGDGTVEATHAFVSSVRQTDRLAEVIATAPQRFVAEVAQPVVQRPSPRLVTPPRVPLAMPDAAPDRQIARLSPSAAQPPVTAKIAAPAMKRYMPEPKRKPERPMRTAAVQIETQMLEPLESSIAASLPALAVIPEPVVAVRPAIPSTAPAPRIALVVTAAGINEVTTRRAIDRLPDGVTLAFAPIGERTDVLAKAAIEDGHTILAEIPMEPVNPNRDPGEPLTLRVGNSGEANIARMNKSIARVPGASGISSYLGAKFSQSEAAAAPVVGEIASRGLFLFENQPGGQSRLSALAESRDVAYASGPMAIDVERDGAMMLDRLSALEIQARRDGVAIGVATAYRDSIDTLERWVAAAEQRGIVFVPVTRIEDAG